MAVNTQDPAWSEHAAERAKVKALHRGRDTAVEYIRKLPGWDAPTLTSIKERAYFLPMVARTTEMFGGLVFMKAPTRDVPDGLELYLEDVTQSGQEIDRFAEQGLDGIMLTGAVMVLVDYPSSDEKLTVAQAEARGLRPVLRLYDANSILSTEPIRVMECVEVRGPDFTVETIEQVRVLELVKGKYQQQVWRCIQGAWEVYETIHPRKNNQPLTEIPAYFCNTRDGEPIPAKPPVTDLADINVAHLNNSAQMEWALAWLGAPVLFAAGIELNTGETIQMGSSAAIVAPNADAKLTIVQADAASVSGLKVAMDDKRRDAAALGARMLAETQRGPVTAEQSRNERAAELSVVGAMANALSQCLTNALAFMAEWAGVSGNVEYWLNTNLIPAGADSAMVREWLNAWSSGALSEAELFALFQGVELVDPAKSLEDHREELEQEGPALGTVEEPEEVAA